MYDSNIAIDVSKCLACGNCVDRCIMDNLRLVLPPCRQASALGINYQGIARFVAQGKMTEAAHELRRCTPFGGLLAAWGDAPASRACSRGHSGGALNFSGILAYLVRTQEAVVYGVEERLPRSCKKAVVAGADAAALQAAYALRMGGHAVTVLSPAPLAMEGVPTPVLEKTLAMLRSAGIAFDSAVSPDVEELRKNFDAVILTGAAADGMSADEYGLVRDNVFAVNAGDKSPLQAMAAAASAAHAARTFWKDSALTMKATNVLPAVWSASMVLRKSRKTPPKPCPCLAPITAMRKRKQRPKRRAVLAAAAPWSAT
ncbi:hypothetical protein [uncultured Mailhella sp.]|uniref:hypothetical protein n=1 Tax=uncultured Mailhella sp. TaxID=1981031 RepID=UPI0025F315C4|nr:hypothetical protein [uncultured Mailhella sp.]